MTASGYVLDGSKLDNRYELHFKIKGVRLKVVVLILPTKYPNIMDSGTWRFPPRLLSSCCCIQRNICSMFSIKECYFIPFCGQIKWSLTVFLSMIPARQLSTYRRSVVGFFH